MKPKTRSLHDLPRSLVERLIIPCRSFLLDH